MNLKVNEINQNNKLESSLFKIEKYEAKYKDLWNDFIDRSKNGTFLFNRDYMEYHSDRFEDYSLMFFNKNKLIAVMPANISNNIIYSHGGLTYGGIVSTKKMSTFKMLIIFETLKEFLRAKEIKKLVYKSIPYIYHNIPAEEDLYALFRHNARLIRRDISSTIFLKEKISYSKPGRRAVNKSKKSGLKVMRDYDFKNFMIFKEKDLMEKYGLKPVHTPEEMEFLAERFPDNIKLFIVKENDELISGLVVYESKNVAHAQYLSSNRRGKELFASDFLLDYLIKDYYKDKKYFDFGISTENNGNCLNESLIHFKEKFGAHGIIYDFYEMEI